MAGGGIGYKLNETELHAAFRQATATGADTLLHVSHVDIDLGTSLMCLMDCFARYDGTLAVNSQNPATIEQVALFFRGDNPYIEGVYDLKKPFAEAKIATKDLPAALQSTIREALFDQKMKETPWWRRLAYLTDGQRQAGKNRIHIPS